MKCLNPERQKTDEWLPRAGVGDRWGVTAHRYQVPFWSDENVLKLDRDDSCTTLPILNCTP